MDACECADKFLLTHSTLNKPNQDVPEWTNINATTATQKLTQNLAVIPAPHKTNPAYGRFQVLVRVFHKSQVFWEVTRCHAQQQNVTSHKI
jgi:hypothetical protein